MSDYKLKSFTGDEWNVAVHVENTDTLEECQYCSQKYKRDANFCPYCDNENLTRRGMNRHSIQLFGAGCQVNVNFQCKSCRIMFAKNSGWCPSCGAPESRTSEDVLADIQRAAPQYLGHVTRDGLLLTKK